MSIKINGKSLVKGQINGKEINKIVINGNTVYQVNNEPLTFIGHNFGNILNNTAYTLTTNLTSFTDYDKIKGCISLVGTLNRSGYTLVGGTITTNQTIGEQDGTYNQLNLIDVSGNSATITSTYASSIYHQIAAIFFNKKIRIKSTLGSGYNIAPDVPNHSWAWEVSNINWQKDKYYMLVAITKIVCSKSYSTNINPTIYIGGSGSTVINSSKSHFRYAVDSTTAPTTYVSGKTYITLSIRVVKATKDTTNGFGYIDAHLINTNGDRIYDTSSSKILFASLYELDV